MFDRFDTGSRKLIAYAQKESELRGDTQIGSEHLLLAFMRGRTGSEAPALSKLGIDGDRLKSLIGPIDPAKRGRSMPLPFTAESKLVLEAAVREANALGHHIICDDHLLLGITSMPDCAAARMLVACGTPLAEIRAAAIAELMHRPQG